jgi:uncharacterized protein
MSVRLVSAVVDTNLFVSALISPRGLPHAVYTAWRAGAFLLHLAETQRRELADVLSRPRLRKRFNLDPETVAQFFYLLETKAIEVIELDPLPLRVRDPNDDPILAAALGGGADYLVTGDDDLLSLAGDPRLGALRIVTARAFLALLAGEPRP